MEPAEDQQTVRPSGAVMVTMVLLKVAWIQARPCGTTRRSRFFLNSFLRFAGFPVAGVTAPSCGSLATAFSLSKLGYLLASHDFLLGGNGALARTLPRAGIGMRALAANRQIAAMTQPAITLDLNQPADIHLNLFAEIALYTAFGLDLLTKLIHLFFGQILHLFGFVHFGLGAERAGARLANPIDGGQTNPYSFVRRQINSSNARHKNS